MGDARIVDQNIEMAEPAKHIPGHGGDAIIAGDVDANSKRPLAQFRGNRGGGIGIDVGDGDAGAFSQELADDARAKPGCAACHQRGLAFKSHRILLQRNYLPCQTATVFKAEKPYSASKPFSRPWPDFPTPPKGSSTPPPAP